MMSNLAEGFDRASRKEFHKFIVVAKGSCAEVRSLLYVALDAGLVSKEDFMRPCGMRRNWPGFWLDCGVR